MRSIMGFSALVLMLVLLAGCGSGKQPAAKSAQNQGHGFPSPTVTAAVATQEPVPIEVEAIGNAQPYRAVQLKSMVDGQIARVFLKQGEDVHAGQLLFQLDKRPFQAALDQAEGKLSQDQATASYNRIMAQRDAVLAKQGVLAQQVAQQQEAAAKSNEAAVQADKAAVESAKVNLGYTDIRAPIDARAGAILVNLGNLVKANDTNPLTTLNQITPMYVQFSIPEAQLAEVRNAKREPEALAYAPNDPKPSVGKLTFINNAVDATTGTIALMATFPNRERRLWPGEFLNVKLVLGIEPHATVVPLDAVQNGPQGKYVYVVENDGTAVMRTVNTPRSYRKLAVITSGIKPGERVIVAGQIKVVPNSKVTVTQTVPVTPAPEELAQDGQPSELSGGPK